MITIATEAALAKPNIQPAKSYFMFFCVFSVLDECWCLACNDDRDEIGDPCMRKGHFKLIYESTNTPSNKMSDDDSKLAEICHKLGIRSALSAKIESSHSDDS